MLQYTVVLENYPSCPNAAHKEQQNGLDLMVASYMGCRSNVKLVVLETAETVEVATDSIAVFGTRARGF